MTKFNYYSIKRNNKETYYMKASTKKEAFLKYAEDILNENELRLCLDELVSIVQTNVIGLNKSTNVKSYLIADYIDLIEEDKPREYISNNVSSLKSVILQFIRTKSEDQLGNYLGSIWDKIKEETDIQEL